MHEQKKKAIRGNISWLESEKVAEEMVMHFFQKKSTFHIAYDICHASFVCVCMGKYF